MCVWERNNDIMRVEGMRHLMLKIKIVSGGQTGVDQGALEAAAQLGLEFGGWAPHGWLAEKPLVLNVAGPRESKSPGIQAKAFLSEVLLRVGRDDGII